MPSDAPAPPAGLASRLRHATDAHADQYRPLAGYGLLSAVFLACFGAFLAVAARRRRLPDGYAATDLALLAVATFKVSRVIAKDRVTSVLRAPFTRFQEDSGHGEVEEAARGRGVQRAVGELLVCQYCLAQWVAAALVAGLAVAPRVTRAVAAVFTVFGLSDAVAMAYCALREQAA